MKKTFYPFFILCICIVFCVTKTQAQSEQIPLNNYLENKIQKDIYFSDKENVHSAIKPYIIGDAIDSATFNKATEIIPSKKWQTNTWLGRKIFSEHLLQLKRSDFELSADFLPELSLGRDGGHSLYTNTRGFSIQGVIGKKHLFSFTTYFYENQSRFPQYVSQYIINNNVVPGQAYVSNAAITNSVDYAYSGGTLSFTPSKFLNIQFGYDKTFIGDGYRSLLLSDNSSNYPFAKANVTLGPIKYMFMFAQFTDFYDSINDDLTAFPRKNGIFHYLSWNINNHVNVAFFENIMWVPGGNLGFSYADPINFSHPIDKANGSPAKSLIGFSSSYKFLKKYVLYSQFVLNEFINSQLFSNTGYWANKHGEQLGMKYFDAFNISRLNLQLEFNTVRPYTYSAQNHLQNYGNFGQPLAHPYGANFREFLMIGNYNIKRFNIRGQAGYSLYGQDTLSSNYGKNIYLSYRTRPADYGNYTGQGIITHLYYSNLNIFYLLNPKNNLGIELGCVFRRENSSLGTNNASIITFGIKSSFRNIYYDF